MGAPGTTPGPWKKARLEGWSAENDGSCAWVGIQSEDGAAIALVITTKHYSDPELTANAHQIKASGALYDALEAADEMQRWLAAEIATRTYEAEELNNPRAWDDFDDCMRDGRLASYRDQFEAALAQARGEA